MKIAVATIFYNSKAELERLINSIPDKAIDWFIGIDGIFKYTKEQNPELPELSNDGSNEIIINDLIGNIGRITNIASYRFNMPNSTEYEKRNKYLEICKSMEIDYLIIVDSDEYFIYNEGITPERSWQIFRRNFEQLAEKNAFRHNVFSIRSWDVASNSEAVRARCWYNPGDMRYIHNSHYHYYNEKTEQKDLEHCIQNRLTYCQSTRGVIKGLTLAHDHSLRTKEQLRLREQYQRYLITYESLVQNGYKPDEAHRLAKLNPSKDFNPTV